MYGGCQVSVDFQTVTEPVDDEAQQAGCRHGAGTLPDMGHPLVPTI